MLNRRYMDYNQIIIQRHLTWLFVLAWSVSVIHSRVVQLDTLSFELSGGGNTNADPYPVGDACGVYIAQDVPTNVQITVTDVG